jgi:hypothetical protein
MRIAWTLVHAIRHAVTIAISIQNAATAMPWQRLVGILGTLVETVKSAVAIAICIRLRATAAPGELPVEPVSDARTLILTIRGTIDIGIVVQDRAAADARTSLVRVQRTLILAVWRAITITVVVGHAPTGSRCCLVRIVGAKIDNA